MTPENFQDVFGVSRETCGRLQILADLLERWTRKINLVAPGTVSEIWHRHIADSAQLWALRPDNCRSWVDLGSGGGFPGLVIAAIAREHNGPQVTLIESDSRKSAFLMTAAREMGVAASVHTGRIEDATVAPPDVISARALAQLPKLLALAAPIAGPHTVFLLPKGRQASSELTEARRHWHIEGTEIASRTEANATILRITRIERHHAL